MFKTTPTVTLSPWTRHDWTTTEEANGWKLETDYTLDKFLPQYFYSEATVLAIDHHSNTMG